jgi:Flp pilus assembly protein TadG
MQQNSSQEVTYTHGAARRRQLRPEIERRQRGSALVELALTAPILIMLIIGVAEFGRFAYMSIEVANAARAGVQYGAQNHITASDTTGMRNAAIADAANVPGISATPQHSCKCLNGTASTCLPTDCTGSQIVEFVQVDTTATVTPMFNYPGVSRSLTLNGRAIMRVEQ